MSQDRSILVPARASTIIASFALALFLDFLPWRDLRLVPDFVALVLAFWCVRQPRLVGLGIAWALGLVSDAGNGVLLGQHALAYSVLAFLAIWMSRRILWFGPGQQALHGALRQEKDQGDVQRLRPGAEPQEAARHPDREVGKARIAECMHVWPQDVVDVGATAEGTGD